MGGGRGVARGANTPTELVQSRLYNVGITCSPVRFSMASCMAHGFFSLANGMLVHWL